jgi:hypothetical protein
LTNTEPRQGFVEFSEYRAIRKHLPQDYQDVFAFEYHSGRPGKPIDPAHVPPTGVS